MKWKYHKKTFEFEFKFEHSLKKIDASLKWDDIRNGKSLSWTAKTE